MAKRKGSSQAWDAASASAYMAEQFRAQMVKGSGLQDSVTAACGDVGMPLRHLCLRLFFQRTSYPFERTMIVFGPTGSNKSTFEYYMYDQCRRIGGMYLHVEVEDKDTPILRLSMTGYDAYAGNLYQCQTMNDFMSAVDSNIDFYKKTCEAQGGPGRRMPLTIGVDSIVAKLTQEASDVIVRNDGVPGRRFADEARALSDWFKYIPTKLQGWPINLIAINHDKPKPGAHPGMVIHGSPGGSAPNFYATYRVLMQRTKQLKQTTSGWEGNRIKFQMEKNGLGADKQSFEAELVWRQVACKSRSGKDIMAQQTLWNWDKATTEYLYAISAKKLGARAAAIDDLLGITKCTGGRYAAPGIGVKTSDPLPATEMGKLIENSPELLAALEPRLGIQPSYAFVPGIEYQEQIAEAAKMADDFLPVGVLGEDMNDGEEVQVSTSEEPDGE